MKSYIEKYLAGHTVGTAIRWNLFFYLLPFHFTIELALVPSQYSSDHPNSPNGSISVAHLYAGLPSGGFQTGPHDSA